MAELETVENAEVENTEEATAKVEEKETKKEAPKKAENKPEEKKSRIFEYMKNEHKWENYVLLALSLFALILGCLIINKTLEVSDNFPLIGNFPKVFAWVLIGLSIFAILLSVFPFFKPAFPEFKKIRWMRPKAFLADTVRVFIFIIALVLLFLLYDAFITKLLALVIK